MFIYTSTVGVLYRRITKCGVFCKVLTAEIIVFIKALI